MEIEDAIELGRRSIYHATFRDAVSGGTVSGASSALLSSVWCSAARLQAGVLLHCQCMSSNIKLTRGPVCVQSIM